MDGASNLYIADYYNLVVRKVTATTGIITTVAGSSNAYYSDDGDQATNAQLAYAPGVAVDGAGNFFVADANSSVILRVAAATGIITTVAGNGTAGYAGDGGPATNAQLAYPSGMADDPQPLHWDSGNSKIRKVSADTGLITTVAGNGGASRDLLNGPQGVAVDRSGHIFVADTDNSMIRKIAAATGIMTTVAGTGTTGYSGDGGLAINARLSGPSSVTVDGSGNLYIADVNTNAIREVIQRPASSPPWRALALPVIRRWRRRHPSGAQEPCECGGGWVRQPLHRGPGKLFDPENCSGHRYHHHGGRHWRPGYSATGAKPPKPNSRTPMVSLWMAPATSLSHTVPMYKIRLLAPGNSRPVLSVTKAHAASFTLATAPGYSVAVSNAAEAGTTTGTLTVSEKMPAGLTLEGMSGSGWRCTSTAATCTRSDALNGGASYPPISVTVTVATEGVSQAINEVTLTGGGGTFATATSDTTNIRPQIPATAPVTTLSAASGTAPVTADSIVSMYGVNISTAVAGAPAGPPEPLPPVLEGVSATITDSSGKTTPIGLIAVTPNQVNGVLPAGLTTGEATIKLVTSSGPVISGDVSLVTVAPSLFTADESGQGIAAAQVVIAHADGSQTFIAAIASCDSSGCTPKPTSLGSSTDQAVLELFGTGIRGAGGAANVSVSVGNTPGPVMYAGPQGGSPDSYYGLDQVNIMLRAQFGGAGTVNVVLTAAGDTANTVDSWTFNNHDPISPLNPIINQVYN